MILIFGWEAQQSKHRRPLKHLEGACAVLDNRRPRRTARQRHLSCMWWAWHRAGLFVEFSLRALDWNVHSVVKVAALLSEFIIVPQPNEI